MDRNAEPTNAARERSPGDFRRRYPTEPSVDEALTRRMRKRERAGARYSSPSLEAVGARLVRFLGRRIDGPVTVRNLRTLTGGASKEQFVFDLDWRKDGVERRGDRMVLRCDPAASIVETTRRREFELMRYAKALMPVPDVHWIDDDGSEMGTPSLVSSFVEGVQKPTHVSSNVTGMGIHFPGEYRRALVPDYARYMAALHRAEPTETDLPSFQRPHPGTTEAAELIINWWARAWAEDLYEDSPIATLTEHWLRRNAPPLDRMSIVHGDFRTGNFLFDENTRRITAVLDWELGYLGDRHGDLGWVLTDLYVTREDGKPFHCGLFESEDMLVEAYETAGGLPVDRRTLVWHKIFCTWKQVVLSLGCALRAGDGLTHQDVLLTWLSSAGSTLSEALRRLLEEHG
jgi:aminoglycoside phosphotransferase (APT) family kinase protein